MRRNCGFSLTELMLTLTVAGVLLTISIPAMNRYVTQWQLDQAHRKVVSELKLLRQKAISEGRERRMWFSQGSGTYWFYEPDVPAWRPHSLPPRVTITTAIFGGGFFDTSMQPDGRALRSGTVVLTNTANQRDTVVVDLSGWAGRP
jgi:prepilin-type N-terminal cleavage/methylation domain-containing protein